MTPLADVITATAAALSAGVPSWDVWCSLSRCSALSNREAYIILIAANMIATRN